MEIGREVWDSLLEAYENAKEAINFFMVSTSIHLHCRYLLFQSVIGAFFLMTGLV